MIRHVSDILAEFEGGRQRNPYLCEISAQQEICAVLLSEMIVRKPYNAVMQRSGAGRTPLRGD